MWKKREQDERSDYDLCFKAQNESERTKQELQHDGV